MLVQCPNCGQQVLVNGLGRKPLNIPFKNICEALQTYHSVAAAAKELNCSKAYIYKTIRGNAGEVEDLINGVNR